MYCFYHGDHDGEASAAIIRELHPDFQFIEINYGQAFPWDKVKGKKVIMTDFSLQPIADMKKLAAMCDLTWIDHHDSVVKALAEDPFEFEGIVETGKAGCIHTWEFFMADEEVPEGIELLGKYDIWDFDDSDFSDPVLQFEYGMRALDTSPDSEVWQKIFDDDQGFLNDVTAKGEIILTYVEEDAKEYVANCGHEGVLEGLKLYCINRWRAGSTFFMSVPGRDKYDAFCSYAFKDGVWTVSLYAVKKEGPHLGEVMKSLGAGGGHHDAAGGQFDTLPKGIQRAS